MTSSDTRKQAVIYARISKDRAGAGLGAGKQAADCRELAERLGLEVIEPPRIDNDLTAFKGGSRSKPRPAYNALLGDLRAGRVDAVLAWHTDRLHRDLAELEEYITVCGEGRNGVPTYTVKGGDLDLSTSNGRMLARILGSVARGEVEHMIERQKSAKERLRGDGAWQGGPRPFGFRPDGPSVKKGGKGRLAQVPAEAAAIDAGYRVLLAGGTLGSTARDWNTRGLLTPARRNGGNAWTVWNVRDVLHSARNAGLIEHQGKIAGPGNWEPIVSEETWRAARAILADPKRRTSPGPKPRWLLSGVLICDVCGGQKFRVGSIRGRRLYQCASMTTRPGMPGSGFHLARQVAALDEYVEGHIIERLGRPDVVAAMNSRPDVDIAALDGRRTAINAELGGIAAARFTWQQKEIQSAPLLDELEQVDRQISDALHGDKLPEFRGEDPAKVWAALKEAGDIERMRAIAAMLLRVRIRRSRPGGSKGGRKMPPGWRLGQPVPFDYDSVEILWERPGADDQQAAAPVDGAAIGGAE